MKRGRRKKDSFQWWVDRITTLRGFKDEARMLFESTGVAYEVGPWAVLKLAILEYYVSLYTTIIKKIFKRAYYLDLFSGPGLNHIAGTSTVILGSPLIADRIPNTQKKFDKLLLIEQNRPYSRALATLLPDAIVINRDVNAGGLEEAFKSIPADVSCLAFVDPEGLELQWSTLKLLLGKWCDAIINFQISGVRRTAGLAPTSPSCSETLDKFFGTDKWKECKDDMDYLRLYEDQIRQHKDYTLHIKVKGPGGFYYYIIIAVRKTGGTQGWIKAIQRAGEHIEKVDYAYAQSLLDIFDGKQATLL